MIKNLAVMAGAVADDFQLAAERARRMGFAGVQLPVWSPAADLSRLTASGQREVRHILSTQSQRMAGLSMELDGTGLMPGADLDRQIARMGKAMEAAKGLAAGMVCVEIGPLPQGPVEQRPATPVDPMSAGLIIIPTPRSSPPPPPTASSTVDVAAIAQVDSALAELGNRADRIGVTLALRSRLSSLASLERALAAVRCPWFGVDFDPASAIADDWPIEEAISRLGGLIRHVRGRDAQRGADRRTRPMPIGAGGVPWPQLLAALDEGGYSGWITIDPVDLANRADAASAGLKHLTAAR